MRNCFSKHALGQSACKYISRQLLANFAHEKVVLCQSTRSITYPRLGGGAFVGMKDVRDRVSELLQLRSFASEPYRATSECAVEEESDMYGFSLLSHGYGERHASSSTKGTLTNLMMDQNWNNPGNVCLMCRAYQIDDTYRSVVFGQTLGASGSTYLALKSQQHHMFSDRYYAEGVAYKSRGLWSESIKSLSDALVYNANHLIARMERADSYFRQNKKLEALSDYKQILAVQPNHAVALERTMLLRNNASLTPLPSTQSTATNVHSSGNSRIQLTDRSNVDYVSTVPSIGSSSIHSHPIPTVNKNIHAKPLVYKNTGLIDKLQQALLENPKYFDTSSSSNSDDDSSGSSSDSGDSVKRDEKKSSTKRKHDERKSSKKEHKASKKRKHKKEKRSKESKRKKKHKSEK